jgi:hypothetical protein
MDKIAQRFDKIMEPLTRSNIMRIALSSIPGKNTTRAVEAMSLQ